MANWAALASTTAYLTLLGQISDRDVDVSMALDPAHVTVTGPITNMVRYNSANKRWEVYNGASWVELIAASSDAFNMTVTGLKGGTLFGNTSNGGIISGGTVDVTTLKQAGSAAWTAATLTNLNQLTNGPGFLVASALSPYATLASPTFTGVPAAPTAAVNTNTTQLATTAYVVGQGYLKSATAASTYAALSGATFTGDIIVERLSAPTAGAVYLGNTGVHYLYFDGSHYFLGSTGSEVLVAFGFSGSGAGLTGTAASLTAGAANAVAWTNVSSRPTTLSAFTNDLTNPSFSLGVVVGTAGNGTAYLSAGGPSQTGYIGFIAASGNRQGYIGFSSTNATTDQGTILFTCGEVDFSGLITAPGLAVSGHAQTPESNIGNSGTAFTLNCALSNVFRLAMTGNVASGGWTISNPSDGQTVNLFITQDGTGGRTLGWPASFKWANGVVGAISSAAGSVSLLVATFRSATSAWYVSLSTAFA